MERLRGVLLAAAVTLAIAGAAGAASVGGAQPVTQLSSGNGDVAASTSTVATTPSTLAPPTTVAPVVTTTTPTSMLPVSTSIQPTTTLAPSNYATVKVINHYGDEVSIAIVDVNSHSWSLEVDESAGPFELLTSPDHGDGVEVRTLDDPTCGFADAENYFLAGHSYLLETVADLANQSCGAANWPRLRLRIHDETTGATITI